MVSEKKTCIRKKTVTWWGFWVVVGCLQRPVEGVKGTGCDSAMGGRFGGWGGGWGVKDLRRFGARWCLSHNTVKKKILTHIILFFVCFDGGETSSIHACYLKLSLVTCGRRGSWSQSPQPSAKDGLG